MSEIILFNPSKEEDGILRDLCQDENIDIIEISMKDLDQKVGYLASIEGFEKNDVESDFEEKYDFTFMLFKGFSNEEIFAFVKKMKERNLYIAHKAAITEHNIKWPLRFLLDENDDEHQTMGLIHEINSLVKIAHDHKEAHGENEEIKNHVNKINNYFNTPEGFNLEEARKLRDELEEMVKKLD